MSKSPLSNFEQTPGAGKRGLQEHFDPESSFDMANLYPRNTGLPHTVYVSPRNSSHDIRIKVCKVPGDRMLAEETVAVALRPRPREVGKPELPVGVMAQVASWATLNLDVLLDDWEGRIDTLELAQRLRKLEAS